MMTNIVIGKIWKGGHGQHIQLFCIQYLFRIVGCGERMSRDRHFSGFVFTSSKKFEQKCDNGHFPGENTQPSLYTLVKFKL